MSRDDALSSRQLHLDYLAFCRQLVGSTVDERIDTALSAATSDNQYAEWMRFLDVLSPSANGARRFWCPKPCSRSMNLCGPLRSR